MPTTKKAKPGTKGRKAAKPGLAKLKNVSTLAQDKPAAGSAALPHRKLVVFSIMMAMFLAAMDALITSTIIPSAISTLGGFDLYPWVAIVFTLTATVATPLYGKLSDLYGHKLFFNLAILIFVVGSVLCGLAQSMPQLIAARALQGIGAGGLMIMSFIMFGIIFSAQERGRMQGLLSSVWGLASLAGPALGYYFVQHLSWRWAFYVNMPLGLLAMWLISRYLRGHDPLSRSHKLDTRGSVLFTIGSLSLLYALSQTNQGHLGGLDISLLTLGAVLMAVFLVYENKHPEAIFPVALLKQKGFLAPSLINLAAGFIVFSIMNFLPIYVQGAMGQPQAIGKVMMSMVFGWVALSTLGGALLNRLGFRVLGVTGCSMVAAGLGLLMGVAPQSSLGHLMACTSLMGGGMGLIVTATVLAVQTAVQPQAMGAATSGIQFLRSMGSALGLSLLGGLQIGHFRQALQGAAASGQVNPQLAELVAQPHLLLDPLKRAQFGPNLLQQVSGFLGDSIHSVFLVAFVLALLMWPFAWGMPNVKPGKGHAAPME